MTTLEDSRKIFEHLPVFPDSTPALHPSLEHGPAEPAHHEAPAVHDTHAAHGHTHAAAAHGHDAHGHGHDAHGHGHHGPTAEELHAQSLQEFLDMIAWVASPIWRLLGVFIRVR